MDTGHTIEFGLLAATVVLTHATYKAVPAEDRSHYLRAVARGLTWLATHIHRKGKHYAYWVVWTAVALLKLQRPVRRRDRWMR